MRLRDPRNASLLILATDTVVITLIVIVAASLAVGFLVGYKISDWTRDGIPFLAGTQPKVPPPESARPPDHEKKPPEVVPASLPQETVKASAEAPQTPPAAAPPAQVETEAPKAPSPAEEQSTREAPAKPAETAKASLETPSKQARPSPVAEAKPRKPARETASAQKTPRDSGAAADSESGAGSGPARVYTIQVGAFPQKDEAEQLRDKLTAKGFKAYVVHGGEEDPYHRVRVGKYKDKKSTEQAAASLREKAGADCYILVTKP